MDIRKAYFEWMYDRMCHNRFAEGNTFRNLLVYLHKVEFRYSIPMDKNRYQDGIDLRYRFAYEHADIEDAESYLTGPCSVLEMMVALAIRCEENIMDDPSRGDRTGQWFWKMVNSLGLSAMYDDRYDEGYVVKVVERFLDRRFEPDGRGSLYFIRDCKKDLREVEIWTQMHWYLNTIS